MKRYYFDVVKMPEYKEHEKGRWMLADEVDAEIAKHNEQEEYLIQATTKIQVELAQAREEIARLKAWINTLYENRLEPDKLICEIEGYRQIIFREALEKKE